MMQLYLMRHGIAGFDAPSDKERALTVQGITQTEQMGHWLSTQAKAFDLVLTSPFLRTQQTWQRLSHYFQSPTHIFALNDLIPVADPVNAAQVILAYAEYYQASKVLVISHMPLLGYLVSELVSGMEPPLMTTSGITRIDVTDDAQGTCIWQESPHTVARLMPVSA